MPIRSQTPADKIAAEINTQINNQLQAIGEMLRDGLENAVGMQRGAHGYLDQTGNLTSSVGGVVYVDGVQFHSTNFEIVKEGDKGANEGRVFMEQVADDEAQKNDTFVVVSAGMPYAEIINDKGLNALDTATLQMQNVANQVKDFFNQ